MSQADDGGELEEDTEEEGDDEGKEDEEDEGDKEDKGDDDCDADTEAPETAGITSDEYSEMEDPPAPKPAEKSKPKKKQSAQALREEVQANRKELSVKGFQRKVFRVSD
jgi:hypothetical protein